jgi:hypothetical protein
MNVRVSDRFDADQIDFIPNDGMHFPSIAINMKYSLDGAFAPTILEYLSEPRCEFVGFRC